MRFLRDHLRDNALLWYVAAVVTLIAAAQLCIGGALHDLVFG